MWGGGKGLPYTLSEEKQREFFLVGGEGKSCSRIEKGNARFTDSCCKRRLENCDVRESGIAKTKKV